MVIMGWRCSAAYSNGTGCGRPSTLASYFVLEVGFSISIHYLHAWSSPIYTLYGRSVQSARIGYRMKRRAMGQEMKPITITAGVTFSFSVLFVPALCTKQTVAAKPQMVDSVGLAPFRYSCIVSTFQSHTPCCSRLALHFFADFNVDFEKTWRCNDPNKPIHPCWDRLPGSLEECISWYTIESSCTARVNYRTDM